MHSYVVTKKLLRSLRSNPASRVSDDLNMVTIISIYMIDLVNILLEVSIDSV